MRFTLREGGNPNRGDDFASGADALERRPQLAAALAAAKARKCSVVVAKLDRLSRDVAFVAEEYVDLVQAG